MKTLIRKSSKAASRQAGVTKPHRGRPEIHLRFPTRKWFMVDDLVAAQREPIARITAYVRLQKLRKAGKVVTKPVYHEGRGAPYQAFALVK